ncbi:unnamed protein product [Acanthoscelides obtectus]|uniref:Uncharacterized protein n=1 Tax=Acanthoscelides obtectus TaxID=200917 RepID=A0A9P0ME79_ACAOB|nr:unnamed protein product [Acanthoscelides obtectus]CAK1624680.1 hypothetical protein AOBTE_LOCUS2693 [Acanthoscelides obtectus]
MTSSNDLSNTELLSKLVELIKKESNSVKSEIKQEIQEIKLENAKILNLVKQQDEKLELLEKSYKKLEQQNLQLERAIRKNNILVFGLEVDSKTANLADIATGKLNDLLGINISNNDLQNIYGIAKTKAEKAKSTRYLI